MIQLSSAAATEIKRLQKINDHPRSYLRIAVRSGGCSDLHYVLEFTESLETRDREYESQGIIMAIDTETEAAIQGLRLDYSEDLMGGGFRFHNPNAIQSCSCGNSFSLASWVLPPVALLRTGQPGEKLTNGGQIWYINRLSRHLLFTERPGKTSTYANHSTTDSLRTLKSPKEN